MIGTGTGCTEMGTSATWAFTTWMPQGGHWDMRHCVGKRHLYICTGRGGNVAASLKLSPAGLLLIISYAIIILFEFIHRRVVQCKG